MNCIPIINENDVVASPPQVDFDLAGVSRLLHYENYQELIFLMNKTNNIFAIKYIQ